MSISEISVDMALEAWCKQQLHAYKVHNISKGVISSWTKRDRNSPKGKGISMPTVFYDHEAAWKDTLLWVLVISHRKGSVCHRVPPRVTRSEGFENRTSKEQDPNQGKLPEE